MLSIFYLHEDHTIRYPSGDIMHPWPGGMECTAEEVWAIAVMADALQTRGGRKCVVVENVPPLGLYINLPYKDSSPKQLLLPRREP